MLIVWELDRELPFVLCLSSLIRVVRLAKREARGLARRCADMTDGADSWTRPAHRLRRKKLRAMTTHTRVVVRKVSNVGKVALRIPSRRNFVTAITGEALVFV